MRRGFLRAGAWFQESLCRRCQSALHRAGGESAGVGDGICAEECDEVFGREVKKFLAKGAKGCEESGSVIIHAVLDHYFVKVINRPFDTVGAVHSFQSQ